MSDKNNGQQHIPLGRVLDFKALTPPVHVAVICPANAAVTMLLNKMSQHGAIFILMQSIPVQVGALAMGNGRPNIEIYPLLVFSMQQKDFEAWMNCKYEAVAMYQMADIMTDKIANPQRN